MASSTYETTAQPIIRLYACNSDISILGVDATTIDLSTSDDENLDELVTQTDAELRIERFEERLSLRVPRGAQIDIERHAGDVTIQDVATVRLIDVSGDVKLRSIAANIALDSIEGDLSIDRAGSITGYHIGGDARCTNATALKLDAIGGSVRVLDTIAVQIERIEGDAHIIGAQEQCQLGLVEGDLRIRNAGAVIVGTVSGDCGAEQIGSLEADAIEGDCAISSDSGATSVHSIGGDLNARIQQGPLNVTNIDGDARIEGVAAGLQLGNIGGDLDLRLEPADGADYQAHVGGDALISLPANCNLTLDAQVEGSISGMSNGRGRRHNSAFGLVLGSGAAQLTLAVDGDLSLRGAALRAQPRIPQPPRVSEPAPSRSYPATGATVRIQPEALRRTQQSGSSDQERLALLRMLSEGRISIDEADRLLAAVDQHGGEQPSAVTAPPASAADAESFTSLTPEAPQDLARPDVDAAFDTGLLEPDRSDG